MKNIYLLLLLVGIKGIGQNTSLPTMTLPSPQAFEMTKFGNIPVDESSGRVSPSIPVFTYTVGALQVPISLSYSGNGVKVEQRPTWTGINWILNAGGVITRVVKDLPDEALGARVFYSATELEALIDPNEGGIPASIKNPIASLPYTADSEVDDFSFSFPGYSGSFILKKNTAGIWEGKLLKYENELKIEIVNNFAPGINYFFKITTPDGTHYYFGGQEEESGLYAVEETQFIVGAANSLAEYGERSKTAFYLTKIENYLGDVINFEYHTKESHEVFAASDVSVEYFLKAYDHDFGDGPCEQFPPMPSPNFNGRIIKNIIYNAKYLKCIKSPQTSRKVLFNSFEVDHEIRQPATLDLRLRVLSNIDFGLGKADFEYLPTLSSMSSHVTPREKFFLKKVTFKNADNTQKNEEYTLEYNDALSVPMNTFSMAQDYLGYYNNKGGETLLPRNSLSYLQYYLDELDTAGIANLSYGNFSTYDNQLGDRSSDFDYATKGILTKIKYPTGGSTAFEYEPVEPKYKPSTSGALLSVYTNRGPEMADPPRSPVDKMINTTFVGFNLFEEPDSDPEDVPQVFMEQDVNFLVQVDFFGIHAPTNGDFVYIDQKNSNGTLILRQQFSLLYIKNHPAFIPDLSFHLAKNGHYIFTMGFGNSNNTGGVYTNTESSIEVSASMQFVSDMVPNGGNGIRIKRVKDYENNTAEPTNIRRFYYKKLKDAVNKKEDTKVTLFRPLFHSFRTDITECQNPDSLFVGVTTHNHNLYMQLHTNSFTLNFPSSDVLAAYPNVTISLGGDNFEQGAIEKTFLIQSSPYQVSYPLTTATISVSQFIYKFSVFNDASRTNQSTFNGTLLEENIWRKNNGGMQKIKKQQTQYGFHTSQIAYNINGQKLYNNTVGLSDPVPDNLFFGLYSTNSHKVNSLITTTKEFIDGVPLSTYTTIPVAMSPEDFALITDDEFEAPYRQMVNTQEIEYNHLAGLPSSIKTTNDFNEIKEIKNLYPIANNVNAASGTPALTAEQKNALNALELQHRINEPFQMENYANSDKLGTQRTLYKLSTGTAPTVAKHISQTSKGTADLEDRIVYHKYDNKGNPVELSLTDGTKVVYIWSNQRKPIYKIVNASYSEVLATMTQGGIFNPTESDSEMLINPFITSLPQAQATIYNYDPISQLIKSVISPLGDVSFYEYDTFMRLEKIKDKYGNTLQKFETKYRLQD